MRPRRPIDRAAFSPWRVVHNLPIMGERSNSRQCSLQREAAFHPTAVGIVSPPRTPPTMFLSRNERSQDTRAVGRAEVSHMDDNVRADIGFPEK